VVVDQRSQTGGGGGPLYHSRALHNVGDGVDLPGAGARFALSLEEELDIMLFDGGRGGPAANALASEQLVSTSLLVHNNEFLHFNPWREFYLARY
jgi:hypothetical protein